MVVVRKDRTDIVVIYGGASLLEQLGACLGGDGAGCLRVVSSRTAPAIDAAADDAAAVIVDATSAPGAAADAVERVLARIGPGPLAVYTERPHEGLELFVRVRGAMFLLGPMERSEWEAIFQQAEGVGANVPFGAGGPGEIDRVGPAVVGRAWCRAAVDRTQAN